MLQEAIQPTAHLQLSCPRPLISLYVSIWAFPLDLWYPRPPFRAWTQGTGEAGVCATDTGRHLTAGWTTGWGQSFIPTVYAGGAVYVEASTAAQASVMSSDPGVIQPFHVHFDSLRVWGEHDGAEFSPAHIQLPVILYLGNLV